MARLGTAGHGLAWRGKARHGRARISQGIIIDEARRGMARRGMAGLGAARPGMAGQGKDFTVIYLIKEIDTDFYKIGYTSRNIRHRLAGLQTGNPRRLEVVGVIEGGTLFDEQKLHQRYAGQLTSARNEWFKLTANDVKEILENARPDVLHQSSNIRDSAITVRQIRRRQQYSPPARGENVSDRRGAVNFASPKRFQFVMRGKHKVSGSAILGEKGKDGCARD